MIYFMTKGSHGRCSGIRKDVSISTTKSGKYKSGISRRTVAFNFLADGAKKITSDDYIQIGIDEETNRIYFRPSNGYDGYKLSSISGSSSKTVKITVKTIEEWNALIGDYDLKKDVKENLYYIDVLKAPSIK